ncbi:hypothetical protein ACLOJK_038173 [Asimina triloba]
MRWGSRSTRWAGHRASAHLSQLADSPSTLHLFLPGTTIVLAHIAALMVAVLRVESGIGEMARRMSDNQSRLWDKVEHLTARTVQQGGLPA